MPVSEVSQAGRWGGSTNASFTTPWHGEQPWLQGGLCEGSECGALSAGWALGLSSHRAAVMETSRGCQPTEQEHSHLLSGQSSLPPWLGTPAAVALAGAGRAGTSLRPMPWQ